jgi:D-beta-D-heptose 7-phosphate kinase / D-beta-D-heptose 1-phosphate adenosyltransferase
MKHNLLHLIDKFKNLHVLVVGEAMLDAYLEGNVERFCPDAPAPVVALTKSKHVPGGAANTAMNVRSLGARSTLVSVVGDDDEGTLVRGALARRGIDVIGLIRDPKRRTLAKQRIVAEGQILIRLDQGSTHALEAHTEIALIQRLTDVFPKCDAVLLSDYGYGIVTPALARALGELQTRQPSVICVDSREPEKFADMELTAVKVNYKEAIRMLGRTPRQDCHNRPDSLLEYGETFLDKTGAKIVAVTLDRDGALVFDENRPACHISAPAVRQACSSGAGDTFSSVLTLSLAAGATAREAAELAVSAASIVVSQEHTAPCSHQDLREFLTTQGKYGADLSRLAERVEALHRERKSIVFTNGCFDILHSGHITYLHEAKKLGDVLIIGVNTDDSIRRIKGPTRPINTLADRIQVLSALSCVDYVVAFDEDTPCNLIRALRPDVFVKGGDYTREQLPEAPLVERLGGGVQILGYLNKRSTTGIIARIRKESQILAEPPTHQTAIQEQPNPVA